MDQRLQAPGSRLQAPELDAMAGVADALALVAGDRSAIGRVLKWAHARYLVDPVRDRLQQAPGSRLQAPGEGV